MIIALLLMTAQAATGAAILPAPMQRVAIDPRLAVTTFRDICLPHLADPDGLAAAVTASPIGFVAIPRRDAGTGRSWRADRALLTYGGSSDGAPRCTLLGQAAQGVDQLALAAQVMEALVLKAGRTRSGKGQAVTDWSTAGADGRIVLISAATRNASRRGTDIRLSAVLAK